MRDFASFFSRDAPTRCLTSTNEVPVAIVRCQFLVATRFDDVDPRGNFQSV